MNYNKLLNRLKDAKFKREDMPVIRSKDYDNFREFLDAMNVGHKTVGMKVGRLKPSQKQIFLDQILDGIAKNGLEKSIKWVTSQSLFIISNDGFIIDGHHRYATGILVDDSIQVNTLRVDLPQKELLKVALDFSDNVAGNDRNKGSSKNINVL